VRHVDVSPNALRLKGLSLDSSSKRLLGATRERHSFCDGEHTVPWQSFRFLVALAPPNLGATSLVVSRSYPPRGSQCH
jgi:hypothetical protein